MNVAIYARVSTQEQAINGHSIDEQLSRMRDYCKAMDWTIAGEHIDGGYTGSNTNRPALQRLIKEVKRGQIDKILVYKLDRLSRSQKDTLELIEDVFLANNTDFVSMSENFDTSTPFGRAIIGILAVFAQLEREQIKERMMLGREARAKQGKIHAGRHDPIGYDYIDGELTINPLEAMQVKRVFEEYASGKSPYKIADQMNEAGLYHKTGKWQADTIRRLIKRKTYIGMINHRGNWLKGIHDSIIDQELFDQCQLISQKRSYDYNVHNRRSGKINSYLGGLLYCGKCGAKYAKTTSHSQNNKYNYLYYRCNSVSKKNKSLIKDSNCTGKSWRMEKLDAIIFDEIRKLAVDPDFYKDDHHQDSPDMTDQINSKINQLDSQMSRLMDLYSIGQMPTDILQEKISSMNDQKERLKKELEKQEELKMTKTEALELAQSFGEILDTGSFDEIRAVIIALIDKIVIYDDDITIFWSFS